MKKLLIVESPSKAKTIEKYLDGDFLVRASVGHIRDLPKSNKKAIDIEKGFLPFYEVSKGKEKVISDLKTLAKKSSDVLLATDPDREGEAIAWHLAQVLDLKDPQRVAFNEITKDTVKEAIKNPRKIDQNLKTAQEARRVLDRLVGYDLSGLIWKKVRYGLSAGRVQSPALRILAEREREIEAFIPEDYFTITAETQNKDKDQINFVCEIEPKTKKDTDSILETATNGVWKIDTVKESQTKRSANAPFTTSTLQQTASSRLGFSPSRTMGVAQKLYEQGLITYMRTDSVNLSAISKSAIAKVIEKKYGKDKVLIKNFKNKSKNAQEAHEAIRPTDVNKVSAGSTEDAQRLYELIWSRTIASQMIDALYLKTKLIVKFNDSTPAFISNGSRITSLGWLEADPRSKSDDTLLPEVQEGDILDLINIKSLAKQTTPPNRYSEAGLVKELEKRGIGRPSTYASIIKTIQDRGYVEKEARSLKPTDTGMVVSGFLEENFSKYISDSFTAEMENELDEIAEGKREYSKTLKDFYDVFLKDLKEKEGVEKITNLGKADDKHKCPICNSSMHIKLGKSGRFLSCDKFPDCSGARTIDGEEIEGPKETGEKCPKCESPLIERHGRYGKFISCSKYPKCKYIKESEEESQKKKTGVKCTQCKDGEMVERRGRFGIFYSCSNYPTCKNAIKAKPTGNLCPMCGKLMMEGTKTIPERCSDKTCPNHRPDKLA